ncbi:hypothetical protein RJ640_027064 [Escallonia rubra]|uniref:Disease resistance R13L4/SHOC-2-like LRR domain-containing protein n=1 Tax=Escallonia rubra TaxID=112253 RepID=A0AA88U214_9ASTE|nr:hypothetical protein RJ640_027064 [Escallonia rubra]
MDFCSSIEKLTNLSSLFVYSAAEHEILDLQSLSSAPQFLRTLELGGRLEKLPHWIPYLHSLVTLWLCYSQLGDDPLQSLEALPNLELLGFLQAYEGESLTFKAGGFQRLKVLWLRRLKGLRSLTMEDGAMPHLEEIYFHNCKLVDELPLGIQHLTNLQFLRLDDMPDKLTMPLQVQDLRGAPLEKIPSLVFTLIHLRYLSMRGTNVSFVPKSIRKLRNLETLDLKYTCVTELPAEILRLRKLRHLLLYRYEFIDNYYTFQSARGFKAPCNIGDLISLQKLCYIEAGDRDQWAQRQL